MRILGVLFFAVAIVAGGGGSPAASAHGVHTLPASVSADVDDFSFDSYTVDYSLDRASDGTSTLQTVETFVARFPAFDQNRGIIRAIPDNYDGVPLETQVTSVIDAEGRAVPYTENTVGGFVELALGSDSYVYGTQSYTITYFQQNVVRAFDDTGVDEFYWDTNGVGFDQPFGTVSARIHIDPSLEATLTGASACYFGPQDSTDRCDISRGEDEAGPLFEASVTELDARENMTVVVAFAPGTFTMVPPDPSSRWLPVAGIVLSALGVLVALLAWILRRVASRPVRSRTAVIAQYSAPEGVNLLSAANVVSHETRGLSAQLIALAVRGNLQLLDRNGAYSVKFISAEGLDALEAQFLHAVFSLPKGSTLPATGATASLNRRGEDLRLRFGQLVRATARDVARQGLRTTAAPTATILTAVALVLLVASVVVLVVNYFSPVTSQLPLLAIGVTLLSAVVTGLFGRRKARLTESGATLRDFLLGVQLYLTLAEEDRFRMLQSPEGALRESAAVDTTDVVQMVKLYEKLLPFAVLFGVERQWAEELALRYSSENPTWFSGASAFDPSMLNSAVEDFRRSSTWRSSLQVPRGGGNGGNSSWGSSGGGSFFGGSSGGGFSGGGGGGGGGGGR